MIFCVLCLLTIDGQRLRCLVFLEVYRIFGVLCVVLMAVIQGV